MILEKEIKIKLGPKNIEYYKNLGYVLPIGKDKRNRYRIEKEKGLLVKIEDLPISSNVKITVQCEDCGQQRYVPYCTLEYRKNSSFNKNGETLCSSCANKRMSGKNSGVYKHGNPLYSFYRNSANKRNINFDLSIDDFKNLTPSTCYYCEQPSNGIDRWNSDIGYIKDNCVPCCGKCNWLKNNTPPKEFISLIEKIYNSLKKKKHYEK